MKKNYLSILFLLIFPLTIIFSQTIVEEHPTVDVSYVTPGFHALSTYAAPYSLIKTSRSEYGSTPYSHNLDECIRDTYISSNYNYEGDDSLPYLMLPPETIETGELYPLVIDAHGQGGIGTSPTDLTGINERLAQDTMRAMYPCYAVSARLPNRSSENEPVDFCHSIYNPYCDGNYPMKTPMIDIYIEMIEDLIANYPIDPNRIYVAGHSHGGHTTRLLITERPDLFAAASPGEASPILYMNHPAIVADNLPIWQIGASNDAVVGQHGLESSYDSLVYYGALDNIFWFTESGSHSYQQEGYREVIDWMFKQNKEDYAARPNADFSVNTKEGFYPLAVTFDGSASAATGGASVDSYEWQIASSLQGLDTTSITYSGTNGTHTFTAYGIFYIRLIVTDNNGRKRARVEKISVYNTHPVASYTFGQNYGAPNVSMTFDASESVPVHGENITDYEWTFGDGASASGKQVTHTYSETGTYTCQLEVTSSGGNKDVQEHEVNVVADFPGYQYFSYIGSDYNNDFIWRGNLGVNEMRLMVGTEAHPKNPMVENDSSGIIATANSRSNIAYRAFDHNDETSWEIRPHILPGILNLNLGYRIMPTGMYYVTSGSGSDSFLDYYVIASVDSLMWDTLYHHSTDNGTAPDIMFPDIPYIEISNPDSADQFGQGSAVPFKSTLFNIDYDKVDKVLYFVNGSFVGSSSTQFDYLYEWAASLPMGMHTVSSKVVYNSFADTLTSPGVEFEIRETSVYTDIELIPDEITLMPSAILAFQATALDQFGDALADQPDFNWSVSGGGAISGTGVFTAGDTLGDYQLYVEATVSSTTLKDTATISITDVPGACLVTFDEPLHVMWDTLLNCQDASGSVYVDELNGKLVLDASSSSCNTFFDRDYFNGIISPATKEDFDVYVKVDVSSSDYSSGSRAGIIVGRNLSPGGAGVASVAVRPYKGEMRFYYDSDEDGLMDDWDKPGGHDGIVWVRMTRVGDVLTAYYSNVGPESWTEMASHNVGFGGQEMQICLASAEVETTFDSLYMSVCALSYGGTSKLSQSITFDPIPDKLITDDPFTVSATASSDLPVSFEILSGPATLSGDEVSLSGETGVVEIEATQEGNESYEAATPVVRSFTVSVATGMNRAGIAGSGIVLAPNPANDYVSVIAEGTSITKVELYALHGSLLEVYPGASDVVDLDVGSLTPGIYLLRVYDENGNVTMHRLTIRR